MPTNDSDQTNRRSQPVPPEQTKNPQSFLSAFIYFLVGLGLVGLSALLTVYMPNIIVFFTLKSLTWSLMVTPVAIIGTAMLTLGIGIFGAGLALGAIISSIANLVEYFTTKTSQEAATTSARVAPPVAQGATVASGFPVAPVTRVAPPTPAQVAPSTPPALAPVPPVAPATSAQVAPATPAHGRMRNK